MMPFAKEISCKWTNHLQVAHCHREEGKDWLNLWAVMMMESDWQSCSKREIQSCVYSAVLCLSASMGELSQRLNEFGALGVLDWCKCGLRGNFLKFSCGGWSAVYSQTRVITFSGLIKETDTTALPLLVWMCDHTRSFKLILLREEMSIGLTNRRQNIQ